MLVAEPKLQPIRAATATDYQTCEISGWYFVSRYIKTLDPKEPNPALRVKPFPSFPFLRDTWAELEEGRNLHILKSRQMLATTLCCAYFLWCLLFRDGWSGLLLSRKDDLVDDGGSNATWNSLFGRVLFMHSQLPDYMRHRLQIRANRISCPARDSYIVGESGNVSNSGRGGVFSAALMDEAAMIPRSESVFSAINDATSQLIMNSTPAGKQGAFYRLFKLPTANFTKLRLHWKLHPDRDEKWYIEQGRNRTAEDIAEELDCSFERSVRGRCIPEFDWDRNVTDRVTYVPTEPLYSGWDFGWSDPTAVVFRQKVRDQYWIPGSLQRDHLMVSDFAPLAYAIAQRFGYAGRSESIFAVGDAEGGKHARQTGKTDIQAYREHGWNISTVSCHERERIRRLRILCKNGDLLVHPSNGELIESLQQLHYPRDNDGNALSTDHSDPKAHEYSHLPDALGYDLFRHYRVGRVAEPMLLEGIG